MKSLVLAIILMSTSAALADHYKNKEILSCRVTKMVMYTYYEESLSSHEYPDVDVAVSSTGEVSMQVGGQSPYEKSEGDSVSIKRNGVSNSVVTVKNQHGDTITLNVEYRRSLARATLRVQEKGETRPSTVAYLMCNTGIF